jgi:hypothetical protein
MLVLMLSSCSAWTLRTDLRWYAGADAVEVHNVDVAQRTVGGMCAGEALGEEDEVSSSSTAAVAGLSAPPNDGPKAPAASQAGMTMATVASPQQQAAAGIVNGSANGHNGKTAAGKQHHGKQGHANGKAAHKRSGA